MTAKISITYNPLLTKNKAQFLFDGKVPNDKSIWRTYKDMTLQSWLGSFFSELSEHYGYNKKPFSLSLQFTGLDVDCEDMENAVREAEQQGFKITYTPMVIKPNASKRLENLQQFINQLESLEQYQERIKTHAKLNIARENVVDIFVVATMSSGKSTFINALLGCDLLPAQNEATTACVAEITHNPELPQGIFHAYRFNKNNELLNEQKLDLTKPDTAKIARDLLSDWNKNTDSDTDNNSKTSTIKLEGNFIGIKLSAKTKFRMSDTPGPTNSANANHKIITLNKIKDTKQNPLILYIIDGSKIADESDHQLLSTINKVINEQGNLAKERFIFLVNRMDEFFGKDENISNTLICVKQYLEKHGIINPKVYPITARLTKLWRINKLNSHLIDEDDEDTLDGLCKKINRQDDRNLITHMPLNPRVKAKISKLDDTPLLRSGVPAIELMISDYIEKYNEPYRISLMVEALQEILNDIKPELDNILQLKDKKQHELDELIQKIRDAEKKFQHSDKFDKFIADLQSAEVGLSDKTAEFFVNTNKKFEQLLESSGRHFYQMDSKEKAHQALMSVRKKFSDLLDDFLSDLITIDKQNQEKVLADIRGRYQLFIKETFDEYFDDIPPNIISNLSKQSMSLDHYFQLNSRYVNISYEDYQASVKRGGFWGSILDLFHTKKETRTRTITKVQLDKFWQDTYVQIGIDIRNKIDALSEQVKQNARQIAKNYCQQLQEQFESNMAMAIETLAQKSQADRLQHELELAERQINQLNEFEHMLQATLSI
ncbi:dynamin family protein [Moraxella oblonga]|uniref:dynamin family protein n=1 Tax=Moraxella oblonga TaxID=200413 RepID=UPI000830E5D6|nr:dynamin family protein [Moraxella oblonga]